MPASTIYAALAVQKFAVPRSSLETKTRSGLTHIGSSMGGGLLLVSLSYIPEAEGNGNVGRWKALPMSFVGGRHGQVDMW